ncbi:MAG: hypothetical protein WCK59_01745 [Candidatus Falkowbacteria bacterium]
MKKANELDDNLTKINPLNYEKLQLMNFSLQDFQAAVASGTLNDLQVLNAMEIIYSVKGSSQKYKVRVNYKNDPRILQSTTKGSIFLESEKKNIYIANPNCAFFTIEEKSSTGWSVVVESILTINQDLHINVAKLIKNEETIENILSTKDTYQKAEKFLFCVSINVLPVMRNKINLVETMYKDFFNKYIAFQNKNSTEIVLNSSNLIIGSILANIHFGEKRSNTYLPISLISCSRRQKSFIYVLDLIKVSENKSISEYKVSQDIFNFKKSSEKGGGVQSLLGTDISAIPVIEKMAYPDDMHEGMAELQNYIFASAINNKINNFPNLSLKYIDAEGKMAGYFISYQGVRQGVKIVYIENLAVDPKNKIAAGRIINRFIEKYLAEYTDKGNPLPIYIQSREETTYFMMQKQFDKLRDKYGVNFSVEEVNKYRFGSSIMYSQLITPYLTD